MWLTDPNTKLKSVTLTYLSISFVATVVAAGLHIAGKTTGVSVMLELTGMFAMLYLGRRNINIGGKINSEEKEKSE